MEWASPDKIVCGDCPADKAGLKNGKFGPNYKLSWEEWVKECEKLREEEAKKIVEKHGRIRLYILAESIPRSRFVYDRNSDYRKGGLLRKQLCAELVGGCPDDPESCEDCSNFNRLLEYLRNEGVLIVDCALCPLHEIKKDNANKSMRHAATKCLRNNTVFWLKKYNAPIITIFPSKRGFLKRDLPI